MKNFFKLMFVAFIATGLTSCLEDENIEEQKYGLINLDANKIVEIPTASRSFSLLIENRTQSLDAVPVHLAASEPAKEDIKVTLAVDAENTTYPAGKYTFPEGMVATIPAGTRDGMLKINVNSADLDPSAPYKIGFKIVSVEPAGYVISGNYGKRTVNFSARNAYEGKYRSTGTFVHPTAGARAISRDKTLSTINATTVETEFADLGGSGWKMWLVVNANNTVTLIPKESASTATEQFGENSYNPATKTFTLNYKYPGGGGFRVVDEKIVIK